MWHRDAQIVGYFLPFPDVFEDFETDLLENAQKILRCLRSLQLFAYKNNPHAHSVRDSFIHTAMAPFLITAS